MRKLTITCRSEGSTSTFDETFDADDLVDPEDVGKRRHRYPRVAVATQEEAERYARDLLAAFNATLREGERRRELVSARLEGR